MILELAKENKDLVLLCSDGVKQSFVKDFQKFFPGRHVGFGLSVENMFGTALGMMEMGRAVCVVVSGDLVLKGFPGLLRICERNFPVKVVVDGKVDLELFEGIDGLKIFDDMERGFGLQGPCLMKG